MDYKYIVVMIIALMMLSGPSSQISPADAQGTNFNVTVLFPADDNLLDNMASFIRTSWAPLQVNVVPNAFTRPVFLASLFDNSEDWDAVIYSFESTISSDPIFDTIYDRNASIGTDIYAIGNSSLLPKTETALDELDEVIFQYKYAKTEADRIAYAQQFQTIYNENWLIDIPLLSRPTIIVGHNGFTGFDVQEDVVQSLFLGAEWTDPPTVRENNREDNELHYPVDASRLINPIYTRSRSEYIMAQSLFSSLLLQDKNGDLHPNLAKSFSNTIFDNNTSVWKFDLYDDVFWSDDQQLDATDVKFTIDLLRFPWIASSYIERWEELNDIIVHNDTSIEFRFLNNRINEPELFAKQLIIPEHILNNTFTDSFGDTHHPYESGNPSNSDQWIRYMDNPITCGPYKLVEIRSGQIIELGLDPSYHYPSELDVNPDSDPYYFVFEDDPSTDDVEKSGSLPVTSITYHISDDESIDENTELLLFESGKRDFIEFKSLDSSSNLIGNNNYDIHIVKKASSGLHLIFNPNKAEVSNYDIRLALTMAIDRTQTVFIGGYGSQYQATSIPKYFEDYYNYDAEIPYNYTKARDIFRENGLYALDSATIDNNPENPWDRIPLDVTPVILSLAFAVLVYRAYGYSRRKF